MANRHSVANGQDCRSIWQALDQIGIMHDQACPAIVDHVSQPWRLLANADGHRDRAQTGDGKQSGDKLDAVAHQQCNPIARLHTALREPRRQF